VDIRRLSLHTGAVTARGTTVIIDVFRAFTCEPLMYHYGAARVLLEPDIQRCLGYCGDCIRVGEQDELPIAGFDLTNSPFLIVQRGAALFAGRTVVHRTTSGVRGAVTALERADEVLLASFVNARATASYIRSTHPALVSIVAMGVRSSALAPEDEACGDYIASLLSGCPYDHTQAVGRILRQETAQKFLRGDKPYLPPEDTVLCLQRDLFDFALRAEREQDAVVARKLEQPCPL
jgi:2-phosphosulfolactate phosphatase